MAIELTREDVSKVALLARLKLSDAELDDFTSKLGQVLGYVEMLNELNTEGVEPMVHAVESHNVFRADELRASLSVSDALANAPRTDGKYFLVPPIL